MDNRLPALETHFFTDDATWSVYVNTPAHSGVALLRERKPVGRIDGADWAVLEEMICRTADRENLVRIAQLVVGNLAGPAHIVPAQVRERLATLLVRHLLPTIALFAARHRDQEVHSEDPAPARAR